jgi:hypothetical protein
MKHIAIGQHPTTTLLLLLLLHANDVLNRLEPSDRDCQGGVLPGIWHVFSEVR